jgi:1D-myo-inositol-triphosphate 3-kinase
VPALARTTCARAAQDAINPREARPDERKAGGISKARYLTYRDSLSSTSTLGFRIDAAMTSQAGGVRAPLKFNFRKLKEEGKIRVCFAQFFQHSRILCRAVLIKLERMRAAFERSTFFPRAAFVRSSILITYDHEMHAQLVKQGNATAEDLLSLTNPAALEVKMIDFAHSHLVDGDRTLSHREPWTLGSDEDGYLIGVDSLIGVLEKVCAQLS